MYGSQRNGYQKKRGVQGEILYVILPSNEN
jgi:hypothetical protein